MGVSVLGRRVPSRVKAINGGRSCEFYFSPGERDTGAVTLDSFIASNQHATATSSVEIQDLRRGYRSSSFYISVPPMGSVVKETPHFFPGGFRVTTGATSRISIVFTNGE